MLRYVASNVTSGMAALQGSDQVNCDLPLATDSVIDSQVRDAMVERIETDLEGSGRGIF